MRQQYKCGKCAIDTEPYMFIYIFKFIPPSIRRINKRLSRYAYSMRSQCKTCDSVVRFYFLLFHSGCIAHSYSCLFPSFYALFFTPYQLTEQFLLRTVFKFHPWHCGMNHHHSAINGCFVWIHIVYTRGKCYMRMKRKKPASNRRLFKTSFTKQEFHIECTQNVYNFKWQMKFIALKMSHWHFTCKSHNIFNDTQFLAQFHFS